MQSTSKDIQSLVNHRIPCCVAACQFGTSCGSPRAFCPGLHGLISFSLSLCLSLSFLVSFCLFLSRFVSFCLYLSLSVPLFPCLFVALSLCLFVSLCLSLPLSPSLSPSHTWEACGSHQGKLEEADETARTQVTNILQEQLPEKLKEISKSIPHMLHSCSSYAKVQAAST